MFKLIGLLLLSNFIFAADILDKLIKMDKTNEVAQIQIPPKRFEYNDDVPDAQKFTAVIRKGALLQDLDGENYYQANANFVIRVREVESGSFYSFVIDKNNKARLVCLSTDIQRIDNIVNLTPKKINFSKENFEYRKIDVNKILVLNTMLTSGTHFFNFYEDASAHSSMGLNIEASFKNQELIPFALTMSFNRISGEILSWDYANLGMKLFKTINFESGNKLIFSAEAQRSLYGQANLGENSISLIENKFSLGATYQFGNWLLGLEASKERLFIPADINLVDNNLENTNQYQTSYLLKLGYSFDIQL
ncbi:hypothetical protein [Bacteriovorax sp. Seq25_V]|uniref:hypothetical protein n=1 Tax=Bacteriovorax sp. Seq25_V TaxID=1201288 RepID=UPI00038A3B63|nr:hypothetical protein [Bacteriovorax sp. Seq25_V]EQC44723.1 hypothetical protein M900_0394 [Bacteriovorax sp. Seq25_V]